MDATPVLIFGRRQEWCYTAHYFGGDAQIFSLSCPSLPFQIMSRTNGQWNYLRPYLLLFSFSLLCIVIERIRLAVPQDPKRDSVSVLSSAQRHIVQLLKIRKEAFIDAWDIFFRSLVAVEYSCVATELSLSFGGNVLNKSIRQFTTFKDAGEYFVAFIFYFT